MNNSRSKTFCILPFVHQMTTADGTIKTCCASRGYIKKNDGTNFTTNNNGLEESWNSDFMKDIRKNMIEGNEVSNCKICYFDEKIGRNSWRQMFNENNLWLSKQDENLI